MVGGGGRPGVGRGIIARIGRNKVKFKHFFGDENPRNFTLTKLTHFGKGGEKKEKEKKNFRIKY